MIEKTVLRYLSGALPVDVHMEVPEDPPAQFVVLGKTGSGLRNHIHTATLAIQSYGSSLLKAAELNEAVKEAMLGVITLDEICRASLDGDYEFTDTRTKRYRYQAVFEITHY